MMKSYSKPSLFPVPTDMEESVLTGSKTSVPMKVNTVEVEEFKDGFATTSGTPGFEDISFD